MTKVSNYSQGKTMSIADLSEKEAREIFGDAVYEAWKKTDSTTVTTGEVVKVDRKNRTITIGFKK